MWPGSAKPVRYSTALATGLVTTACARPANTSATARRIDAIAAGALDASGCARLGGDPFGRARRPAARLRRPLPRPPGSTDADRDVEAEPPRAPRQKVRVGQQIEWRQRELVALLPGRECDVRTDPGRLAERQRERPRHGLSDLDQRLAAQLLEILLRQRLISLLVHRLRAPRACAGELAAVRRRSCCRRRTPRRPAGVTSGGVRRPTGVLLRTSRCCCAEIGGLARDRLAHRDVRQRHREAQPFVAALEARAQALGIALARLEAPWAPRRAAPGTGSAAGVYSKPVGSCFCSVSLQFHGDFLLADLQARLGTCRE